MGEMFGRLITGAIWGAAAGAALIFGKEGGAGLRTAAKTMMKGFVAAEEKIGEMRDTLDDLYAETKGPTTAARPTSKRIPIEHSGDEPRTRPGAHGNGTTHAPKSRARARS